VQRAIGIVDRGGLADESRYAASLPEKLLPLLLAPVDEIAGGLDGVDRALVARDAAARSPPAA